jgi:hypothetical protein
MKDTIPTGRGMVDVQLLVVNRFDQSRLCKVGEIGEIYVRAAGLAEGYLGSPELNEKKFIQNWFMEPQLRLENDRPRQASGNVEPWRDFYLGPRDRLYRTGDLGRYTLRRFADEISRLQDMESFTSDNHGEESANGMSNGVSPSDEYSNDAKKLVELPPNAFSVPANSVLHGNATVFLTGATGYLGAYILQGLLSRSNPSVNVVALVRAKSSDLALERVRSTCKAYGSWSDSWTGRV